MSPRPYRLGKRQVGSDETRARIVAAARDLLTDTRASAFTIDAVAERADVARMTVYYQFKSKGKLLEALFDDFGARANMRQLSEAFRNTDAIEGIEIVVQVFCRLWQSERTLLRRLNALAALDPEVEQAMIERRGWRREGLAELVGRLSVKRPEEIVDLLHMLTSFETYDTLASANRSKQQVVSMIQRTARGLLAKQSARNS